MKKTFLPAFLLLFSAACSDKSLDRDILKTFERHSYQAQDPPTITALLRSGGPEALKPLDRHAAVVKGGLRLREMQGGGLSSGLLLGESGGGLYILKVFRGSTAGAAGLKEGDRILGVNGRKAASGAASKLIRGAVSFNVKIVRRMPGGQGVLTAAVKKEYFRLPLIFGLYDPFTRTAFIKIAIFGKDSGRVAVEGVSALSRLGAEKVVFDLRGTAGGLPDEAAALLTAFAPEAGPVFEIRSRHKGYSKIFNAPGRGEFAPLRTAVLVNSGTAMAAEVFAAALKDLNGAVIVGAPTMGEVSLQKTFKVGSRGNGLRLTVARFFPPSGKELEEKGLTPDIKADLDMSQSETVRSEWSAAAETALMTDPALRQALAALKE